MYSRRTFRTARRRRAPGGPGRRLGLAVAGASVPVLVAGYALRPAHSERAVNTASVSYPAADPAAPDPAAGDPGSTSGQHHHHRYWWWGN